MVVINNLKGFIKEFKEYDFRRIGSIDYLENISMKVDLVTEPLNSHLQPIIDKGAVHFE
jgi:hypothetical protein